MNKNILIDLYKKMCLIRYFEETVSQLRFEGQIYGAVHCCIGQEAVSAGVCGAMSLNDYFIGTHRSHGFMIARNANINKMMAELFGKQSGTNGGRGGSLHVCDPETNALGATGIVGSGIPIACGAAFASKYKGEKNVAIAFLGDGAANEGVFYESLNLASVWNLPVLFVVENNGMAVTTQNITTTANVDIYKHAFSFEMNGQQIDGQDVELVYNTAKEVIGRVREKSRPELLEIKTYRFHEHAEGKGYYRMHDVGYRDNSIIEEAIRDKDPIRITEKALIDLYKVNSEELLCIKSELSTRIRESVEFAKNDYLPQKETASGYVFV